MVAGVTEATPAAAAAEPHERYAGLVTRLVAIALDAAIINAVAAVVAILATLVISLLPDREQPGKVALLLGGIAFGLWIVAYFVTFWTTTGETPGNRVMRIRVVRLAGSPPEPAPPPPPPRGGGVASPAP